MISVIIPTYNREKTIKRSITSVLKQTYSDIELWVVDDCSTDDTKQVVKGIADKRLHYYCLEKNSGACSARNKGIELSRGEYIAFQDSDDEWLPNKLQIQMEALEENNADVVFTKLDRCNEKGEFIKKFPDADPKDLIVDYKYLIYRSRVSTQTILAKREIFEKFKFDPNVKKSQDYDWVIRVSEEYKFCFIKESMVIQYIQNDSITQKSTEKALEMNSYFLRKYEGKFHENRFLHISLLNRVAKNKELLGIKADKEYKEIFSLDKNLKNATKFFLCKIGLLSVIMKKKTYKN